MLKNLSSQVLLDRWEDRRACQNVIGKFSHSYVTKEEGLIYDRFWSKRDDVCLGLNNGWYDGAQAVSEWYAAVQAKNVLCSRLIKDYFPQELGENTYEECFGVGLLGYKSTDTCVLEVASDGETAKGLWCIRGGYMDLTSSGMVFKMVWGFLAADFIKEGGEWKIWHMQKLYDVDSPVGQGWSEPPVEYEKDERLLELDSFKLPEPNKPCVLREYYHADRKFSPTPTPPKAYDTFSHTFSYGI
jgi:hypothetical protein